MDINQLRPDCLTQVPAARLGRDYVLPTHAKAQVEAASLGATAAQQLQPQPPFFDALTHRTIVLGQLLGQIEHVTSAVRSRVFGTPMREQRADGGSNPVAGSPMYDATMTTMDDMIEVARRALHDAETLHGNL